MKDKDISLLIAVPCFNKQLLVPTATTLFRLIDRLARENVRYEIQLLSSSMITELRNAYAAFLLESKHSHLLFIDSDMETSDDAIIDMIRRDKEIIGLACPAKTMDWDRVSVASHCGTPAPGLPEIAAAPSLIYSREQICQTPFDAAIPIEAIGTGITLIKRTVFEKLRDAMPELEYRVTQGPGQHVKYYDFFGPLIRKDNRTLLGEDFSLCYRAASIGIQTFVLTNHRVAHYGLHEFVFNRREMQAVQNRVTTIARGQ